MSKNYIKKVESVFYGGSLLGFRAVCGYQKRFSFEVVDCGPLRIHEISGAYERAERDMEGLE